MNNGLILIVDDTEQNLEVLASILTENQYDLAIATNGIEALDVVNTKIPDLILLDVMMPEMDGIETCRRLKQNERTKNIPIIFLTAKVETEDILQGFLVGGIDYITKPFRKEELLARVGTHVQLQRTQKSLSESENKLRNLVENSEDGIILLNEEGVILEWNPKMEKMTGLFLSEVKELPFAEIFYKILDINNPNLEQKIKNDFKNMRMSGEIPHSYKNQEVTILNIDGTRSTLENSFFAIEAVNGFMIGANFRDITVRKRIREEIEKIQKLEAIGTLAGGIAHNFNNLMQGIVGNIDLALMSIKPENKSYDLLCKAMDALPRARALTNELITFARGGTPVKQKFNIADLFKIIINELAGVSVTTFDFEISEKLWLIEADQVQIKQALKNIFDNAIQAMPKGGIVSIKAQNISEETAGKISSIIQKDKYIAISIQDQGVGIPRENYTKIFDPFFTTNMPLRKGLGLSISHSIIRRHEGYIDFKSEIGAGTTFNIYFPAIS